MPASQPQRGGSPLAPGVSRGYGITTPQKCRRHERSIARNLLNYWSVVPLALCMLSWFFTPRLTPGASGLSPRCGWNASILPQFTFGEYCARVQRSATVPLAGG